VARSIGGCLSFLLLLCLLAGGLYAGWRWDPVIFPHVRSWMGVEERVEEERDEPSVEVAEATLLRIERFLQDGGADSLSVNGVEVSSVLRYSVPGILPPGLSTPHVRILDGEVLLRARLATDGLPSFPELEQVVQMLPDTVPVELRTSIMPFRDESAALLVRRIEVSGIPLPRHLHPRIMEAMGRVDHPGLPPEAMRVPLPKGLSSVYAEGDRLILVAGA